MLQDDGRCIGADLIEPDRLTVLTIGIAHLTKRRRRAILIPARGRFCLPLAYDVIPGVDTWPCPRCGHQTVHPRIHPTGAMVCRRPGVQAELARYELNRVADVGLVYSPGLPTPRATEGWASSS